MRPAFQPLKLFAILPLLAWAADASALGLGEIRTASALGERLRAEVEVIATGREALDASCFRLTGGQGDDGLPWLRQASLALRKGTPWVLQIVAHAPTRDPILQVGVAVACGHEVQRTYTLFLSPHRGEAEPPVQMPAGAAPPAAAEPRPPRRAAPRAAALSAGLEAPALPRPAPPRPKAPRPAPLADRLVLSGGGEGEEPNLRLATALGGWNEDGGEGGAPSREARRDILRLEFRTLMALNEQAVSQLAAAEKLRNLESALGELQQRAGEASGRQEGPASQPAVTPPAPAVAAPPPVEPPSPVQPEESDSGLGEWAFYGALLAALAGVGGWLGWRQVHQRREALVPETGLVAPEIVIDPRREDEVDEPGGVDLPVEPAAMGMPMAVDFDLDAEAPAAPAAATPAGAGGLESSFSVSAATVHEHFEANPVMELAEIMLSFGRVKGAAQALQEFIDNSPDEALQPWIRLMDVYRMAGMREEFERVAKNLNQHFNVEVQHWEAPKPKATYYGGGLDLELDPIGEPQPEGDGLSKATTIEDIPHICEHLVDMWRSPGPGCIDYLQTLLRDTRGGTRSGFTLQVVAEVLFLVELRETLAEMAVETGGKQGA